MLDTNSGLIIRSCYLGFLLRNRFTEVFEFLFLLNDPWLRAPPQDAFFEPLYDTLSCYDHYTRHERGSIP